MLTLNDGRKELYQWDTGRTATIDIECDIVHFSCLEYGKSPAVKVKGGIVEIPNDLLMLGADIKAWGFVVDDEGGYTKEEQVLKVNKRPKPSDYVYTETEVVTVETAVNDALEKAKERGEFKGDKGDKGDRGEQGVKGEKGEQGIQGEKGDDYVLTSADKNEIADIMLQYFVDVSEVGQ
jgi:hypothetical protein